MRHAFAFEHDRKDEGFGVLLVFDGPVCDVHYFTGVGELQTILKKYRNPWLLIDIARQGISWMRILKDESYPRLMTTRDRLDRRKKAA